MSERSAERRYAVKKLRRLAEQAPWQNHWTRGEVQGWMVEEADRLERLADDDCDHDFVRRPESDSYECLVCGEDSL